MIMVIMMMIMMIQFFLFKLLTKKIALRGHSFSTYAKFSEKLTFLNRWYADVCTVIDRTYHRNASEAVLLKKNVIENFAKFTEKHLYGNLFFNNVSGWCFPVNFSKISRKPFLQKTFGWLFLNPPTHREQDLNLSRT